MAYIDDMTQVWHLVREDFRPVLSDTITDLWLGGLEVKDFQGSTIIMSAESEIKIRVVTSKYKADIEKKFSEMLGFDVTVNLVCSSPDMIPTTNQRSCPAAPTDPSEVTIPCPPPSRMR